VHQDRGVRGAAAGLVVERAALAVPGVGAHHQDVERLLGPLHLLLGGTVLEDIVDLEDGEVAVEVAVEVDHCEAGHEREDEGGDEQHLADCVLARGATLGAGAGALTGAGSGVRLGVRGRLGAARVGWLRVAH
jgi:hypothetical protein